MTHYERSACAITRGRSLPGAMGVFANGGCLSSMASFLQFTKREWQRSPRLRRHVLASALAAGLFAYLGPFRTGTELLPWERIIYWYAAIPVVWLIGILLVPFISGLAITAGRPRWLGTLISAPIAAVPGSAVVVLLEWWFRKPPELAVTLLYIYASVALVFLVLGFLVDRIIEEPIRRRAEAETARESVASPPSPEGGPARFLDRLPRRLGRNLLHLQMRDHYVEAHTDEGSTLVLMRFRDALGELDGLTGAQVHRSHWVAGDAVENSMRRDGRLFLLLTNGSEIPVSRSFVSTVREQGWL